MEQPGGVVDGVADDDVVAMDVDVGVAVDVDVGPLVDVEPLHVDVVLSAATPSGCNWRRRRWRVARFRSPARIA